MAAVEETCREVQEYSDFKCQFDKFYAASVINGHKEWIGKSLVDEIRSKFSESSQYRILSVGSGTGYPDQGLLEVLSSIAKENGVENRKIAYTVSEPDPKAVAVCKENLEKGFENLNIDFQYDVAPSEKFLLNLEQEYDLIYFVHVISWLKDHETILVKCYEKLLAKNGLIAIVDFNKEYFGGDDHCEGDDCHEDEKARESSDDEKGDLMYVEVDLIANKQGWKCRKFSNDLKIDLSEASKSTEAGRQVACSWSHVDPSSLNDDEKEKTRVDLVKSLTKEVENGEPKYYYILREMIYFLTK